MGAERLWKLLILAAWCLLLPSALALTKQLLDETQPSTSPIFVLNFDSATVICQLSDNPMDLKLMDFSVLCDGRTDCYDSPLMNDESLSYCAASCPDDCNGRGACLTDSSAAQCYCDAGYHGDACHMNDTNECGAKPCSWLATCTNTFGAYQCHCLPGFAGDGHNCTDVNECAAADGGGCPEHSSCVNLPGTHMCQCQPGYRPVGQPMNKCIDVNECETEGGAARCPARQSCLNTPGSYDCVRRCPDGYTQLDRNCIDVDECATAGVCHERAQCTNTAGGHNCTCERSFEGDGTECKPRTTCDLDPSVCDANAFCVQPLQLCMCNAGWHGDGITCSDIDECSVSRHNCPDEMRCLNVQGGYVCCAGKVTDLECKQSYSAMCHGGCGRNAICVDDQCQCRDGFVGDPQRLCQDINECEQSMSPCAAPDAWCVNKRGSFACCTARSNSTDCRGLAIEISGSGGKGTTAKPTESTVSNGDGAETESDQTTTEKPADVSTKTSGRETARNPADVSPELPIETTTENPAGLSTDSPGETTSENPADVSPDSPPTTEDDDSTILTSSAAVTKAFPDGAETTTAELESTTPTTDATTTETTVSVETSSTGGQAVLATTAQSTLTSTGGDLTMTTTDDAVNLTGQLAEGCASDRDCPRDAVCEQRTGACRCLPGFIELPRGTCKDIDECLTGRHDCDGSAECVNIVGSYMCSCAHGHQLIDGKCFDIDDCVTTPCHSDAICVNNRGSYECKCKLGYRGDGYSCLSVSQRACSTAERQRVAAGCDYNRLCLIETDSETAEPSCDQCANGYRRDETSGACLDIDECEEGSAGCSVDAQCTNYDGGYTCSCAAGYVGHGVFCQDIDECTAQSGTSPCHPLAECKNTPGSFTCTCAAGYFESPAGECVPLAGDVPQCSARQLAECGQRAYCSLGNKGKPRCIARQGFYFDPVQGDTIDMDECAEDRHECDRQRASCVNTPGGYECRCKPGYSGDGRLCVDVDECARGTAECDPNALCANTVGSYVCACAHNYQGDGTNCTEMSTASCAADDAAACADRFRSCFSDGRGEPKCGACLDDYIPHADLCIRWLF